MYKAQGLWDQGVINLELIFLFHPSPTLSRQQGVKGQCLKTQCSAGKTQGWAILEASVFGQSLCLYPNIR